MTAVDDELMRPSVCGTIPVLREKDGVGFGSPKERGKKPQHRTGLRLFCSCPSFGGPNGEAQASPVTLRVPRSSTPVRAAAQCGSWSAVVHQERLEHPTCSQNTLNTWTPFWRQEGDVLASEVMKRRRRLMTLICGPSARITQGGRFDFF